MPIRDYGVMDILGNPVTLPRADPGDPDPFPVQFHVVSSPPCIHKTPLQQQLLKPVSFNYRSERAQLIDLQL